MTGFTSLVQSNVSDNQVEENFDQIKNPTDVGAALEVLVEHRPILAKKISKKILGVGSDNMFAYFTQFTANSDHLDDQVENYFYQFTDGEEVSKALVALAKYRKSLAKKIAKSILEII